MFRYHADAISECDIQISSKKTAAAAATTSGTFNEQNGNPDSDHSKDIQNVYDLIAF